MSLIRVILKNDVFEIILKNVFENILKNELKERLNH